MMSIIDKLVIENASIYKWKTSTNPPSFMNYMLERKWNLSNSFFKVDNSKTNSTFNTKWMSPQAPWTKLKFDGFTECGMTTKVGVLRNPKDDLILSYEGNLNYTTSNLV